MDETQETRNTFNGLTEMITDGDEILAGYKVLGTEIILMHGKNPKNIPSHGEYYLLENYRGTKSIPITFCENINSLEKRVGDYVLGKLSIASQTSNEAKRELEAVREKSGKDILNHFAIVIN